MNINELDFESLVEVATELRFLVTANVYDPLDPHMKSEFLKADQLWDELCDARLEDQVTMPGQELLSKARRCLWGYQGILDRALFANRRFLAAAGLVIDGDIQP
tara:strand:+ start:133 stop:444 length:312 start_codon:yes stop_codon:yes gene_type:complete